MKAENLYDWEGKEVVLHLGGEVAGCLTYRGQLHTNASSVLQLKMKSGQVFRVQQELIVAATLLGGDEVSIKPMGFVESAKEVE